MTLRSIVAVVLSFILAVAMAGLYAVLGPQTVQTNLVVGLLLLVPTWIAICAAAFIGSSARRAYAWLVAANTLLYSLLWITA